MGIKANFPVKVHLVLRIVGFDLVIPVKNPWWISVCNFLFLVMTFSGPVRLLVKCSFLLDFLKQVCALCWSPCLLQAWSSHSSPQSTGSQQLSAESLARSFLSLKETRFPKSWLANVSGIWKLEEWGMLGANTLRAERD